MSKKCYFCDKGIDNLHHSSVYCRECSKEYRNFYDCFFRLVNYIPHPRVCEYCGEQKCDCSPYVNYIKRILYYVPHPILCKYCGATKCDCAKYTQILRVNFWQLIYAEERRKNKKSFYETSCANCDSKVILKINRTINAKCRDCQRERERDCKKRHYIPHPRFKKTYEPLEWWLRTMGGRTENDVVADKHGLYIKLYTPKTKDKVEKYYLPDEFQVKKHALPVR